MAWLQLITYVERFLIQSCIFAKMTSGKLCGSIVGYWFSNKVLHLAFLQNPLGLRQLDWEIQQSATVSLPSAVADTALPGYTVFEQFKSLLHGAIQSMKKFTLLLSVSKLLLNFLMGSLLMPAKTITIMVALCFARELTWDDPEFCIQHILFQTKR